LVDWFARGVEGVELLRRENDVEEERLLEEKEVEIELNVFFRERESCFLDLNLALDGPAFAWAAEEEERGCCRGKETDTGGVWTGGGRDLKWREVTED
jgi:hypothetical protein